MSATELFAAALKLPPAEREMLAVQIMDTLDATGSEIDELSDEEFEAELLRRAAELRSDPSAGIPWEQVREMR